MDFKNQVEGLFHSISEQLANLLRDFYGPYGLTAPQAMILMALYRKGPGKISDMAKSLHMTNSNLSVICKRMEKSGFVVRKRDDLDQRVVHLYLTDGAKALMDDMDKRIATDYLRALEEASDQDKTTILNGLTKLDELLKANQPK